MKLSMIFTLLLSCGTLLAWQNSDVYETIRVQRYLIPVNVTDRDGNPITDLKAEDFELKLGREDQTVESLTYVNLDIPQTETSEQVREQGRRMFIFFFDLRFNNERGVLASRKATIDFVKNQMRDDDLAAAYVGTVRRGVWPLINFTNDKNQLISALDNLGLDDSSERERGPAGYYIGGITTEILGSVDAAEYQSGTLNSTGGSGGFSGGTPSSGGDDQDDDQLTKGEMALEALRQTLLEAKKMERRDYATQVQSFTQSFQSFGRALSFIRGRKNLVLFSSGFDSSQLVGFSNQELSRNAELSLRAQNFEIDSNQLGNASVQSRMSDLVSSLQGSGTLVFAVDTSGLDDQSSNKSGIQSLNMLAKDTGGQLFENENNFAKPLAKVKEITSEYYVLTVAPQGDFEPGDIERLRVDVKRSGAKIYAQKGLMIRPDFQTLNPLERQLHIADYIAKDRVSQELPLQMTVHPVMERTGLVRLAVELELDGSTFLDAKRTDQPIEYYVMVIDRKENLTYDSTASQYRLDLSAVEAGLKQNGLRYVTSLLVPPGEYRVKAVARDLIDGRVGSAIETMTIAEAPPRIYATPLDAEPWITLEGSRSKIVEGVQFEYPFKVENRIYSPSPQSKLDGTQPATFIFTIGDTPTGSTTPDVRALIQKSDGSALVIPPELITVDYPREPRVSALTPVLLRVDLPRLGLAAGEDYNLLTQIILGDGEPMRHATPFSL